MYEQYTEEVLNNMPLEELVKIPREFWAAQAVKHFQSNYDIPLWCCPDPDDLPCHGKRMYVKNREGQDIRAIVYKPESAGKKKLPVYFHIHGGGFNKGYAETNDNELDRYRNDLDCWVIGVGYRLSPQYQWPAAIHDIYDVIKYFVSKADEYGFDLDRIGIGGESSGGNLTNAVTLLSTENNDFNVKMQMLVMPNCNFYDVSGEGALMVYHLENIFAYVDYAHVKDPHVSAYFIPKEMLVNMPTTVMISGENDDLHIWEDKYCENLRDAGVEVIQKRFLGCGHVFALKDTEYWMPERMEEGLAYHVSVLRRYLLG